MYRKSCNCFEPQYSNKKWLHELKVHEDTQDYGCTAWKGLLVCIDEAARDKREILEPAKALGAPKIKHGKY